MVRLAQRVEQKQHLTPRQILEAHILQLSLPALEKKIFEELESNPILEVDDDDDTDNNEESEKEEDFEWDELISNPDEYEYSNNNLKDNDVINFTPKNNSDDDLIEDIIDQLQDLNTGDNKIEVAVEILGNLNDSGYLTVDPVIIADRLGLEEKIVLDTLKVIKSLDPPGIGSRDLQDCIASQIKVKFSKEAFALEIIENYFEDFANKRYNKIIKKTNCSVDELNKVVEIVSVLSPNPAINYFSESAEHITPDFIIEKHEGEWTVMINNSFIPELRISRKYLEMLEQYKDNKDVKKYVKNKIDRANWFIAAIIQRNSTYKKVMLSIIKHQKNYFESDDKTLEPLILKNIADDIKMDISTISRVTSGKYVQMPWGIKKLKLFFSESIKTQSGKVVSSYLIKDLLQNLVNDEDKSCPFSDDVITDKINKLGYIIARRTIAKYRELLNIPSARLRKKIK